MNLSTIFFNESEPNNGAILPVIEGMQTDFFASVDQSLGWIRQAYELPAASSALPQPNNYEITAATKLNLGESAPMSIEAKREEVSPVVAQVATGAPIIDLQEARNAQISEAQAKVAAAQQAKAAA